MRKILQWLLKRPLTWLAGKLSSAPDKKDVFNSLSQLLKQIETGKGKAGIIIPFDISTGKFIIFSDQHKGSRDDADDFKGADNNYMTALQYYFAHTYLEPDYIHLSTYSKPACSPRLWAP